MIADGCSVMVLCLPSPPTRNIVWLQGVVGNLHKAPLVVVAEQLGRWEDALQWHLRPFELTLHKAFAEIQCLTRVQNIRLINDPIRGMINYHASTPFSFI